MSTHIIQYEVKPDQADENARLSAAVYEQLRAERPEGLHYATFRLADGVSFVHIVSYDDDDADVLRPLAAFQAFQKDASERIIVGPERGVVEVVGSYGFFGG